MVSCFFRRCVLDDEHSFAELTIRQLLKRLVLHTLVHKVVELSDNCKRNEIKHDVNSVIS